MQSVSTSSNNTKDQFYNSENLNRNTIKDNAFTSKIKEFCIRFSLFKDWPLSEDVKMDGFSKAKLKEIKTQLKEQRNGEIYSNEIDFPLPKLSKNFLNEVRSPFFSQVKVDLEMLFGDTLLLEQEDSIFGCDCEMNKQIHKFFIHNFFNASNSKSLPAKCYELTRNVVGQDSPYSVNQIEIFEYAYLGVKEILRDNQERDLVTSMQENGFSDGICFLMYFTAQAANQQIVSIIEHALKHVEEDPKIRNSIVDELNELMLVDGFSNAALGSEKIRNLIVETMRLHSTNPTLVRKFKEDDSVLEIPLSVLREDRNLVGDFPNQFIPDRFKTFKSKYWPSLPFLPFGSGPNMCPGWKLSKEMMTQFLAHVIYKNIKLELED